MKALDVRDRVGDFYVLNSTDWVNIVALTDEDDLVLIEQWRHGVERVTLEIPGGMVDPGETPADAAARELLEETGYAAETWHRLGQMDPNPAILNNTCYSFLARGCQKQHEPQFDGNEQCRVVLKPYKEVGELVASGAIVHALVNNALFLEHLRRSDLSG